MAIPLFVRESPLSAWKEVALMQGSVSNRIDQWRGKVRTEVVLINFNR